MKIGVFLQARLASNRFPNKIIAPFGEWTIIENAIGRLHAIPADVLVVVTDDESKPALDPIGKRFNWEVFAGHPTDVMKRFIDAANLYGVEVIVRATADNPLVDPALASFMLATHLRCQGAATRAWGATPGTATEIVNAEALKRCYPYAGLYDREHVMPVIYAREQFNTLIVKPRYRESVTIDTPADLARVEEICEHSVSGARVVRED